MGVLSGERGAGRLAENAAFGIFAVLTAVTVYLHEPWADEANSWLLGRDASLVELWTRLTHYEGTPGLWQTLLHLLIRLRMPYAGLNAVSGAMGCAAAWMIMRKAPFPLAIRLASPFTFYIFFQYSVVARSYCLVPILLFGCAAIYRRADERPWLTTALLCLLAGVSVHGMIISGAIAAQLGGARIWRWRRVDAGTRWKWLRCAGVYAAALALLAWSAWPAKDVTFASVRDYSAGHLWNVAGETVGNAFTGEWISSLVVVAVSLPLLFRGGGLWLFLVAGTSLCVFNAFVYTNVWHEGMLFLVWVFAMWISEEAGNPKWAEWPGRLAVAGVICIQGYWAEETARYDWGNPYSGARAAARYLKAKGIEKKGIYGFGFACVGVQPYFASNIFPNFRDGERAGYYDWSEAFRNFEDRDDIPGTLNEAKPEYVMAGYKNDEQKYLMRNDVKKSGYRMIEHFEGNLFWHDEVLEPDALDLFRRVR